MILKRALTPAAKAKNLEGAAAALRAAERAYRSALVDGDLLAAVRARELVNSTQVAVEAARAAIEGVDE